MGRGLRLCRGGVLLLKGGGPPSGGGQAAEEGRVSAPALSPHGLGGWLGVVLGLGKGAPVAGPRRGWAGSARSFVSKAWNNP